MNIEERVAAMRAGRAAQTQAAPAEIRARAQQTNTEGVVEQAQSSEKVFDIANNTVAKIMDRSDLSDQGKLEAVVEFLTSKDQNYSVAEKNFAEFEAYFTYEQSKRTQVSEQHIQRLMNELQDGTKSTIERILHDFNIVNTGAGTIKQLLKVMEKARIDGMTVEVLTDAYRLNEKLLKEISGLKELLATGQQEESKATEEQDRLKGEKKERSHGALNKFLDVVFGSDDRADGYLYYSSYHLNAIQVKVKRVKHNIETKEGQRNKKLEDGELTILRTVDATEGGFTQQIFQTAEDSLELIKGTRVSIEKLLAANAKSRAASTEISDALNKTMGRETILKGALQVVATETHLQGNILSAEVDRLMHEKAEAAGDDAQVTLATLKLNKVSQTGKGALNYEHVLEAKVVSFGMLASANVQAEARAQQFAALVDSHGDLLSNLQQQALPVTASALEMGLQQGVALRDGLLAAGVRDATKKAQEIFGSNLEGATEAKTRLESENLNQMRAAILALGQAQALITERTNKAIEHGLTSMDLVNKVTASADAVRAAMSDFQKVDAALTTSDHHTPTGAAAAETPAVPEASHDKPAAAAAAA